MTAKKVGRPEKTLTEKQINEIEELAKDLTIEQMADYFDVSERTFQRIKDRDSDVLAAYKKGKSHRIKEAVGLLWEKMKAGDTTATIFYLKTQAGWSEKQQMDVTTKDLTPKLAQINLVTRTKQKTKVNKHNESSDN